MQIAINDGCLPFTFIISLGIAPDLHSTSSDQSTVMYMTRRMMAFPTRSSTIRLC
jgi:hypothetical protein